MENETERTFARNVKALREARGWSQGELARVMERRGWPTYSQMTVSRTEKSERPVRLSEALDLASALGTSLQSLLSPQRDAAEAHEMLANMRSAILGALDELDRAQAQLRTYIINARSTLRALEKQSLTADDQMLTYIDRLEHDIERLVDRAERRLNLARSASPSENSVTPRRDFSGEHPEAPER